MTRYLLAAEADKIQDFIFCSSRLREVVGGSQLLSRFCEVVPRYLLSNYGGNPDRDIIINDAGSFRILFDDAKQAMDFGEQLAEVYHRVTGGSLAVAEPVEVKEPIDQHFAKASEEAEKSLRRAKRWCEDWQSQEHLPYMALCASCGVGLAVTHQAYYEDEDAKYICISCRNKSAKREDSDEPGIFLKEFYLEVVGEEGLIKADWPGKKKRGVRSENDPVEEIADYDPRRYVAYLLADGNSMGEIFSKCKNPEQMRRLSTELAGVIRQALAVPTKKIMKIMKNSQLNGRSDFIPVLPLILGGDDLFALIPAPWALDFAACFCQAYEDKMTELLKSLELSDEAPQPTVSAVVVICKSKYPYTLAHAAGKARLKKAKGLSKQRFLYKQRFLDSGKPCSVLDFEVMLGGCLTSEPYEGKVRPTLRPYWIIDEGDEWGLPIKQLIDHRWKLCALPRKRLLELKNLYDEPHRPDSMDANKLAKWQNKLERLVKRIEQRSDDRGQIVVRDALKLLGGNEKGYWRQVSRDQDICYGHGLPDLLEAWDFALSLDKSSREYEEG